MKISNETKIGALAVVAVALLIIGFNFLKGNNLFSRTTTIYAFYDNVGGLAPASPVRVNGLKIGTVSDLEVTSSHADRIMVKLTVQPGIEIPQNSVASIVSSDLLGTKAVVIEFGNASVYLQNNDTIQSAPGSSITTNIMSDLKPLSGKIQNTLVSLDTVLNDLHTSLDNETRNNLKTSIAEFSMAMKNFSKASAKLDTIAQNVNNFSDNLVANNDTINQILSNTKSITTQLARADIDGILGKVDTALFQLNDMVSKLNKGHGSLGKLMNDDRLYDNLRSASYNLNLLTEDLRINPQRYVHLSIFGRKNKAQPLPSDTAVQQ